ncbi:pectinesterase inhibitor 4-like [Cicer arietinum]|uniref:Pectinesterase inhibitor 4-like n=1 Tax=Cicer arietinum TaxID=3827 RepID=A0A1S2Y760_CICAR|nr:pectinesterase inhibitor 4-like [Cicer arietinum]
MGAKTIASSSNHVFTFAIFILLAISSITLAYDDNSKYTSDTLSNSTKTNENETNTEFTTYITKSCNSTTYPSICHKSLSRYASKIEADPVKLCNIALSVALKAAHNASATISKHLKSGDTNLSTTVEKVLQDCSSNFEESIEQLQDSIDAMKNLDGVSDKEFQISNIKTWVSSAITNDQTCYDEFDEMNVDTTLRDQIRSRVLNVVMKTSNALYFINHTY